MFKKATTPLIIIFAGISIGFIVLLYNNHIIKGELTKAKDTVDKAEQKLDDCSKECGVKFTTNVYPNFNIDEKNSIKIGLNYPETGPYSIQGLAQLRASMMAVNEINAKGGILNKTVQLVIKDTISKPNISSRNVQELIDDNGCKMIFGGSSSGVAIAGAEVAKSRKIIYFGTLTYSNATTKKDPDKNCTNENDNSIMNNPYMFRECYNSWMGAKVLSNYLLRHYPDKKYFYITADYTWGHTTEASIRKYSKSSVTSLHKSELTRFPGATQEDFKKALEKARKEKPDILVLVLFGKDMSTALTLAYEMGLKKEVDVIIVPNLTLGMAKSAGPEIMEGVIGALPWTWTIPFDKNFEKGKRFVKYFVDRYGAYPSTSAASAYNILYQYKDAAERVNSFASMNIIKALEGYSFIGLKDRQLWRTFDHQCIQTVYAVRCKAMKKAKYSGQKMNLALDDYFEIIAEMTGEEAARSYKEWCYGMGE